MAKLSDDELVAIIEAHRRQSLGDEGSELASERAGAMDRYHGRPYGDEQEGRSQVVSKDVADTVGWLMPAIMKVFVSAGNIAEFAPSSEEDETTAQQESDYINHVIMKDNEGFLIVHDWVKDTLLLKNGYVKHWWDETETVTEREYEGLSQLEIVKLFSELEQEGSEVEVLEQDSIIDDQLGELFTVNLRITTKKGRVRIEAIPTEEIRISKRARNGTQNSQFIEHFPTRTRTELIEMGMDAEWVNDLPAKNEDSDSNQEQRARSTTTDENDTGYQSSDRSMDEIEYSEAYLLVDYDQDGKAELRKVVTVAGNMIPPGKEWNEVVDCIPITSMVSKRVPHRHIGESIDDDLADLQRIKTVLMRGLLDNSYFINNSEIIVNQLAHLPDFVQSLPGGVKRIKTDQPVAGMTQPLIKAPMIDQILPAIDYVDRVKDDRSGINELTTNVDADVLKNANNATFLEGVDRAAQKVEMIIRMIAETGIKELVLRVHEILMKHQDKARMIKLRGEYQSVNPTEWRERTDLSVSVGIGNGTEEQQRQKLGLVSQLQASLFEMGLVTPRKAYNLFNDTLDTMGIERAGRYALDPDSEEYMEHAQQQQMLAQQPQPNPLAEAEMVKAQAKVQTDQMDAQVKMALQQQAEAHQMAMARLKAEYDAKEKEADRLSKEAIEAAKLEAQAALEGQRLDVGKEGIGAGLQESV
ncbi:MAG: hypothetical protein PVI03_02080 [Candidatus Thorarchaeota archaeon]|jgi:hypothetical protein